VASLTDIKDKLYDARQISTNAAAEIYIYRIDSYGWYDKFTTNKISVLGPLDHGHEKHDQLGRLGRHSLPG